jgi:hydrogenase-4 component F
MTLVGFARNFGLLWIAIEATTLLSAPLICFQRTKGALEAMWKYLLICSLGIGLALFGIFFMDVAFAGNHGGLSFASLAHASKINTQWCKVAFIFCFAGFGLKMGLAPFHNWLPDAYSESASPVAALMSAGLINCSFLAILRVLNVMPATIINFYKEFMIIFGVISLLTAAFFMIHQFDYKRMLAYSSVEHMGILSILWAIDAQEMAILHMCMHSLIKMILFFVAGNITLAYISTKVKAVNGMINRMPVNAILWGLGILMICGMPPSPLFVSEFILIKKAGPILGGIVIVLLFTIFAAMTRNMMSMALGKDPLTEYRPRYQVADKLAVLPAVLMAIPFGIGVYLLIKFAGGIL